MLDTMACEDSCSERSYFSTGESHSEADIERAAVEQRDVGVVDDIGEGEAIEAFRRRVDVG